jgi:hypothetical protein
MDGGSQGRQYGRLSTGKKDILFSRSLLPQYWVSFDSCEVDIYQREEDIRLKVPLEGAPDTDGSGTRLRVNMICGRYGFLKLLCLFVVLFLLTHNLRQQGNYYGF